jgi:hypothetical protein
MKVARSPRGFGVFGVVLQNQLVLLVCEAGFTGSDVSLDFVLQIRVFARGILLDSFFILLDRLVDGVHAEIEITGLKVGIGKLFEIALHLVQQCDQFRVLTRAVVEPGECEAELGIFGIILYRIFEDSLRFR